MLPVTPLLLILTLIVPPAIITIAPGASLSAGVAACSLLWMLVSLSTGEPPFQIKKSYSFVVVILVIAVLVVHAVIASRLVSGVEFGRLISSCLLLLIEVTAARLAADKLLRV